MSELPTTPDVNEEPVDPAAQGGEDSRRRSWTWLVGALALIVIPVSIAVAAPGPAILFAIFGVLGRSARASTATAAVAPAAAPTDGSSENGG
jgi:hypothetical protein